MTKHREINISIVPLIFDVILENTSTIFTKAETSVKNSRKWQERIFRSYPDPAGLNPTDADEAFPD